MAKAAPRTRRTIRPVADYPCRVLTDRLTTPYALFTDGGMFGSNASPQGRALGGSVAARLVSLDGAVLAEWSGVAGPLASPYLDAAGPLYDAGAIRFYHCHVNPETSSNLTETVAILYGLPACLCLAFAAHGLRVPPGDVTVCSDSEYALSVALGDASLSGLHARDGVAAAHAVYWRTHPEYRKYRDARALLLAGHPSRADLARGTRSKEGKDYPVSPHNVWCDAECRRIRDLLREALSAAGDAGDAGATGKESPRV